MLYIYQSNTNIYICTIYYVPSSLIPLISPTATLFFPFSKQNSWNSGLSSYLLFLTSASITYLKFIFHFLSPLKKFLLRSSMASMSLIPKTFFYSLRLRGPLSTLNTTGYIFLLKTLSSLGFCDFMIPWFIYLSFHFLFSLPWILLLLSLLIKS